MLPTRYFSVLFAVLLLGTTLVGSVACSSDESDSSEPNPSTGDAGTDVQGSEADTSEPDTALPDTAEPDSSEPDSSETVEPPGLDENFGETETEGSADCENLNASHCLFPFPSDYFRHEVDGVWRLDYGPTSLPQTTYGYYLDPEPFRVHDGYSNITPILFRFPGGTLTGIPGIEDIAASLDDDSKTVILDSETGERVAHWAEHDHFTIDGEEPVYTIRLAKGLEPGRRYIVAVRGLVNEAGDLLEADPGFVALRDAQASHTRGIHARRAHFETKIFGPLTTAGVDRAGLQLAFDFTTASDENVTSTVRDLRVAMAAAMGADGPEYSDCERIENPHSSIALMVRCTAKIPSFLLPPEGEANIRLIRRDADGNPVAEGFEDIEFEVQFPHKAFESTDPLPVLQYGHGLFGRKAEAHNGWMRDMANRLGFIVVAVDFQGFSENDVAVWGVALGQDVSQFPKLVDTPVQGLMNQVAIMRMMKQRFANETDMNIVGMDEKTAHIDPSRLYYYGNSQGGTMGSMLMTVHTDVTRGVLGVPGGAYAFLLNRSSAFVPFSALLRLPYPESIDFAAVMGLLQTGFQRFEPHALVHRIHDPWPDVPAKTVLLHVAKEDSQVHNQASFMLGRTVGVKQMVPSVRPVFGLPEQSYPYSGSALLEYDFNKPDNPKPLYPPPDEHDTHGDLRKLDVAQDQLWHFLETGEVINVCDGVCDPD